MRSHLHLLLIVALVCGALTSCLGLSNQEFKPAYWPTQRWKNASPEEQGKRAGINVLKGATAALASLVGLVIGSIVSSALNMPMPMMPANVSLTTLMPLMFLSGILIAIILSECFRNLYQNYWQRLLVLWLCNYLLYYLLNTLDAFLFTTMTNLGTGIIANLFPALFLSAMIALL